MRRRPTGRDFGLAVRIAVVFALLMGVLAGAGLGIAALFFLWPGYWLYWLLIAVVLAVGLVLHYRGAEQVLLHAADARLLGSNEEPELHRLVERLAALADMSPPRIGLSNSPVPNAFAVGLTSRRAVIVVTKGLRAVLKPAELEAVIAHEVSHIGNRDALVMTSASVPRTLGAQLFGAEGLGIVIWFFLWPFGLVLWSLSTLLTFALSRYREFVADRGSALLTGAPEQLMSALQKLSSEMGRIPRGDLRAVSGLNALFIVSTSPHTPRFAFLGDHPPLDGRLRELGEITRELGRPVP